MDGKANEVGVLVIDSLEIMMKVCKALKNANKALGFISTEMELGIMQWRR